MCGVDGKVYNSGWIKIQRSGKSERLCASVVRMNIMLAYFIYRRDLAMDDNSFKIMLKINGKEKLFTSNPTGRVVRDAAALQDKLMKERLTTQSLDEMVDFAVKLFGNQFTPDEMYDGTNPGKLGRYCLDLCNEVVTRFYLKGEKLPNAETGKQN